MLGSEFVVDVAYTVMQSPFQQAACALIDTNLIGDVQSQVKYWKSELMASEQDVGRWLSVRFSSFVVRLVGWSSVRLVRC